MHGTTFLHPRMYIVFGVMHTPQTTTNNLQLRLFSIEKTHMCFVCCSRSKNRNKLPYAALHAVYGNAYWFFRSPYVSTIGAGSPLSHQHSSHMEANPQPPSPHKYPVPTVNQHNPSRAAQPTLLHREQDTNHSSANSHNQRPLSSGPNYDDYVDVYTNKQPVNNSQLPQREREPRQVGRQGAGFLPQAHQQRASAPPQAANPTWSGGGPGVGTSVDQPSDHNYE